MQVDIIFQIAAIGIIVAVVNLILSRAGKDEYALMTTIAGIIIVLLIVVRDIKYLFDYVKATFGL